MTAAGLRSPGGRRPTPSRRPVRGPGDRSPSDRGPGESDPRALGARNASLSGQVARLKLALDELTVINRELTRELKVLVAENRELRRRDRELRLARRQGSSPSSAPPQDPADPRSHVRRMLAERCSRNP